VVHGLSERENPYGFSFGMKSGGTMKQARYALCGRGTHGMIVVKYVEGQRLEFHEGDCGAIFGRLTAVYAIDFGLSLKNS
jgi:hypothetical protein